MDRLKQLLLDHLPLSADALLLLLGLLCYLGSCLVFRRPLTWPWALLPGLLLALAIEAAEIWAFHGGAGLGRAGAGGLAAIVGRHLRDVAVMTLPSVLVFLAALVLARWDLR